METGISSSSALNQKPRIMALDIGQKRTGVALCDHTRLIATPYTSVESENKKTWVEVIRRIAEEEEVGTILVGMPLDQHGEEGADAVKIRKFIALLQERVQLPVVEWDERFSTVQAERTLITAEVSRKKRKEVIDKVVAAILLQSYLDSLRFHLNEY
jgi:putative holliday junction resolvase